jgi:hypothetical protein
MITRLLGFAAVVAVAACGGSVVSEGATGGSGAGTTGTGAGTSGTGAGTSSGPCPPSAPTTNSCAGVPNGFRCTYGDSVRPDCRVEWSCLGGQWLTQNGSCGQGPCAGSEPATGTVCTNMGDVCVYGDSICECGCGGGFCGMPVDWQCSGPPTTPGCPAVVPNDGTPCSANGLQCTYGNVCMQSSAMVSCKNGLWLWNTMIACGG